MSNTPETDAKASDIIGFFSCATVPADFARKLERERDEWYYKAHANFDFTLEARAERDKARQALRQIFAETDGRNPSHIGQDRAFAIAKEAAK